MSPKALDALDQLNESLSNLAIVCANCTDDYSTCLVHMIYDLIEDSLLPRIEVIREAIYG